MLWARERVFTQFMLSCPFRICLWKFICKIFKILTKIWRWNHSKRMNHLFLINFSNSVFSYANCSAQICTLFLKYLSFFSIDSFELILFFFFSVTPQSCIFQRFRNFLWVKIIFLNKTASTEYVKQEILEKLETKTTRYQKTNTMEFVK